MSAAIHPFPGRDPNIGLRLPVREAGDDLLAELAAAVGSLPVPAGGSGEGAVAPDGRRGGARATVTPIAAARRGGANDLVMTEHLAGASLRRHHLVLAAVVVAFAVALAMVTGVVGARADGDVPVVATTTLEDGETLWGLATEITPAGGDVRDTVALLLEVNDFASPSLPTGTPVRLPDLGA